MSSIWVIISDIRCFDTSFERENFHLNSFHSVHNLTTHQTSNYFEVCYRFETFSYWKVSRHFIHFSGRQYILHSFFVCVSDTCFKLTCYSQFFSLECSLPSYFPFHCLALQDTKEKMTQRKAERMLLCLAQIFLMVGKHDRLSYCSCKPNIYKRTYTKTSLWKVFWQTKCFTTGISKR